jgi:hypothetical protein
MGENTSSRAHWHTDSRRWCYKVVWVEGKQGTGLISCSTLWAKYSNLMLSSITSLQCGVPLSDYQIANTVDTSRLLSFLTVLQHILFFIEHVFTILQLLKIEKCHHKCQNHTQNKRLNNMKTILGCASCSLVEIDWCFRGAYCLCHEGIEDSYFHTRHLENLQSHLSTKWQPCDIYIQLQFLHTRWQHYADKERGFIDQKAKSKGADYSLMWTKVKFCRKQ